MGINELAICKPTELSVIEQSNGMFSEVPNVTYALVDSSRYSFDYHVNDDIDVNMYESDRAYDSDEFIDAEFDTAVSEKDYSYYTVAVASGVLTGLFSQLKLSDETLAKIKEWKEKEWDKYIIIVAQIAGYKRSDLKGAISFLKKRFVVFVDEQLKNEIQDGIETWIERLSYHPSVAGLIFSIFTQFSGEYYSFGENGLNRELVPDYYALGRNTLEKLVYGVLYWAFNLSVDVAISKRNLLDDMKIPAEVIKLLKKLIKTPLFNRIPSNYKEAEKLFSDYIKKLFENSQYKNDNGEVETFDLQGVIEDMARIFEGSVPVMINECIVRAFYLIKKLTIEINEKQIKSFDELEKVNAENILPFNNRLVSRMVLISSGCFMGVNIAGATLKALIKENKEDDDFSKTLFAEISIAGVGRFIFACVSDSKYWSDDVKVYLQRREKNKKVDVVTEGEKIVEDMISNESYKALSLDPVQTRVLYSMEALAVAKDIEHTNNEEERQKKQLWLELWQSRILGGIGIENMAYFVNDEKSIYNWLCSVDPTTENLRWYYLLTMEITLFNPYYPLGTFQDKEFKKLKRDKYNYIDDQFVRRQTIVSQSEVDAIRDSYKKYKGIVSGNTQNVVIAAGVAAVTALATGGLAFVFAPGIATLIAGEAVVGLHGAALTSASLAFVGGGSLAAGGLGMAGGTAIITGGGALLGVAGSGSASMAAIMSQTGSDYWLRQSSKLLVFSKCVLHDKLNDIDAIKRLDNENRQTIRKVENGINEIGEEHCSLDKDTIKNSKECLKYLKRCKSEMEKMVK